MQPLHQRTPCLTRRLDDRTLHLKMEAWQPSASFKLRGVGRLCQVAQRAGASRLVTSSGGNAGLAMAYAARALGLPATVYVPSRTSEMMRARITAEGATVVVAGDVWDEADVVARGEARDPSVFYVHPFEHPEVWRGHATMVEELADEIPRPDAIALSVGGGGLLAGVLEGMDLVGWGDVPLLAVETRGAHSLALALAAGEPVTLDAVTSLATTLGAKRVSAEALRRARSHDVRSWLVSDRSAVRACVRFANQERVLVEPACGATLAAVYERAEPIEVARSIAVVVCGGAAVDLDQLAAWSADT